MKKHVISVISLIAATFFGAAPLMAEGLSPRDVIDLLQREIGAKPRDTSIPSLQMDLKFGVDADVAAADAAAVQDVTAVKFLPQLSVTPPRGLPTMVKKYYVPTITFTIDESGIHISQLKYFDHNDQTLQRFALLHGLIRFAHIEESEFRRSNPRIGYDQLLKFSEDCRFLVAYFDRLHPADDRAAQVEIATKTLEILSTLLTRVHHQAKKNPSQVLLFSTLLRSTARDIATVINHIADSQSLVEKVAPPLSALAEELVSTRKDLALTADSSALHEIGMSLVHTVNVLGGATYYERHASSEMQSIIKQVALEFGMIHARGIISDECHMQFGAAPDWMLSILRNQRI